MVYYLLAHTVHNNFRCFFAAAECTSTSAVSYLVPVAYNIDLHPRLGVQFSCYFVQRVNRYILRRELLHVCVSAQATWITNLYLVLLVNLRH